MYMDRLRQAISGILLILSLLAPSMACGMASAPMNAAEQECCKKMAGSCDSVTVQHTCCRSALHEDASQLQAAVERWSHSGFHSRLTPAASQSLPFLASNSRTYFTAASSPPIFSHPSTLQILRV